jgi:hypothetical protein
VYIHQLMFMRLDTGCDKQDPHKDMTAGLCSRSVLMRDALLAALGQLLVKCGTDPADPARDM